MCSPWKDLFWLSLCKQPEASNNFDFDSPVCSLTLGWDAHRRDWPCSGMHTKDLVVCRRLTPQSEAHHRDWLILWHAHWGVLISQNLEPLTPRCDANCRNRLHSRMHTVEIDLAVWCTLWSDAYHGDFELLCVLDSWKILTIDSAVWCTPESDLQWNVHCVDWISCVMHTAEIESVVGCTLQFFSKFGTLDSRVWCTLQSLT